jgi:hypothetical protein
MRRVLGAGVLVVGLGAADLSYLLSTGAAPRDSSLEPRRPARPRQRWGLAGATAVPARQPPCFPPLSGPSPSFPPRRRIAELSRLVGTCLAHHMQGGRVRSLVGRRPHVRESGPNHQRLQHWRAAGVADPAPGGSRASAADGQARTRDAARGAERGYRRVSSGGAGGARAVAGAGRGGLHAWHRNCGIAREPIHCSPVPRSRSAVNTRRRARP